MATYRLSVSVDIVTDEPVDSPEFADLMAANYTNWILEELKVNEDIDPRFLKVQRVPD